MTTSVPKGERTGGLSWKTVVGVSALVMIVIIFVLLPVTTVDRMPRSRRALCFSNEKQILLAIGMYAENNQGRCPMDSDHPTLLGSMRLLSNMTTSAIIFHCPSDPRPGARAEADFTKLTMLNISYSYVPRLQWQDQPDSPVILDRINSTSKGSSWPSDGNHGTNGGNVGFNDGHVAWNRTLPYALKQTDGKEVVLSP